MIDDFLLRAGLAALGVALPAAALGCFVVWRRMAYFGDATAHAAILGVALALALSVPVVAGVLVVALAMALGLNALSGRGLSADSLLGVFSHGALAVGLLAVALVPGRAVDLDGLLFGDVLTVRWSDLAVIWGAGAVTGVVLWRLWGGLIAATLSPDLAVAAGFRPGRDGLVLTLLLAVQVAVAIKVVGALLITALLIVPAAAARGLARSPEAMALMAALIGGVSALGGLWLAVLLDTPVGPTIVSVAVGIFALVQLGRIGR